MRHNGIKTGKFLALAFFGILVAAGPASGNVSIKNGNFFMGYTDIVYPGGFDPKIERVYNSKTPFRGIFGWGWGNEYEAYLTVSADGSVVVHEYGGGAENRFNPVAFNAKELEDAVNMLADIAKKSGEIGSAQQLDDHRRKLRTDARFRNKQWEKYRELGKVKARQLRPGTQLTSNRFSYQYVTKVENGYVRTFDNGRIEQFTEGGKLARISDKNKNTIEITYGQEGHPTKLVDNFNRKMFFSFNSAGLLEKIDGENGKVASYKYNGLGELNWSKDVDGNVYTYKYDRDHNMTEIGYADKTTMAMTYYGRDKFGNIKTVKDRDGTTTGYAFDFDAADRDHLKVAVSVSGTDGKKISASSYEYFFKRKADGEQWTYRMVSTLDGDRTDTIYNECCGLPLQIRQGKEETSFEYDIKGHVTKKITPNEVTELSYDVKVSKVNRVVRYSKRDKKDTSWSEFRYDSAGNLTFAKNSRGKGVQLFYDGHGRIMSMLDQDRRRIDFKYNENSKPIEITDPQLGTITVQYTNSGEIKKVESSAGRKIALQVTSAFQNLLDIIRPAGVSLSF